MTGDLLCVIKFLPTRSSLPSWAKTSADFEICYTKHYETPAPKTYFWQGLEEDFANLVSAKENRNVLIAGTSGQGKTTLLAYAAQKTGLPAIYFSFKPDDLFLRLGIPILDVGRALPDLSQLCPDDVVTAYMLSYTAEFRRGGIMAAQIPTLIRRAADRSESWHGLLSALEQDLAASTGLATENLNNITTRFKSEILKNVSFGAEWRWDFAGSVVVDFSRFAVEPQRVFWAEIFLRFLWRQLQQHRGFAIVIDEAHTLTQRVEHYSGIIDLIARQARSLGAVVLIASQNLSDIPDCVANQFATQLVFKTTHAGDLNTLARLYKNLPNLIGAMLKYHFFDLRSPPDPEGYINVYRLKKELLPKTTTERKYVEAKPAAAKPPSAEPEPPDLTDLRRDILRELREGAAFVSSLGRELEAKYNKPAEKLKVDAHIVLKELVREGIVCRAELEDQFNQRRVYYWLREKHESPFHRVLVEQARAVLADAPEADPRGADLVISTRSGVVAIECETGLKTDTALLSSFVPQIKKRLEWCRAVWVVVPNRKEKERFARLLGKLKNVRVLTLKNLKEVKK